MLLSVESPKRGSLFSRAFRGHAAAPQGSGASSPAGVGWEHVQTDNRGSPGTWENPVRSSANSRLETPGDQLRALAAHSSAGERNPRVHPRYRQAKETKRGGMAAGRRSALIVLLKQGNSPRRTLWREAKCRPADPVEGNMPSTSRLDHMSTTLERIASGPVWMAKLSVEEPDALMRARPALWEPWVGNHPLLLPAFFTRVCALREVEGTNYRDRGVRDTSGGEQWAGRWCEVCWDGQSVVRERGRPHGRQSDVGARRSRLFAGGASWGT